MQTMRLMAILLLVSASSASGQDISKDKRYEIEEDIVKYPQQTPQQAMQSVAKLVAEGKLEYLLAHLVEPAFVDDKVEKYKTQLKGPPKAVQMVAFHQL